MKQILAALSIITALLAAGSCAKVGISPEELFNNSEKVARITIKSKAGEAEEKETTFRDVAVYRKSDLEGKSWFVASSGGRMADEMFMLSLYFDSIDRMKVGDTLKTSRCMFSFLASSDSNATTYTYSGQITLAGRGDGYVILHFNQVRFNCSFGEYLTDGYLYCPLLEEFRIYL